MTLSELRADAHACFAAAVAAVEPATVVARCLAREGDALVLRDASGALVARHTGPVAVVGAGKAVVGMAHAVCRVVGPALRAGIVIAPYAVGAGDPGPIAVRFGAHPIPDRGGVVATTALLEVVRAADRETLVLVILSGGASALLVAPVAGISLDDKQALTRTLLTNGAEIGTINAVRKHCSRVKGGRLAQAAAGAGGCWTLVLSDVVGDDLATIASGPTVPDPTTYADAIAGLARYGVRPPPAIEAHLARGVTGTVPETPKPGDPSLGRVPTVLVGRNADAVAAASIAARARGYAVTLWPEPLRGDAAEVGERLAGALTSLGDGEPVALVAGGETTVRARPGGLGGRSQHLALVAALRLAGARAVLLAAGTDGIDGPTGAAGGCVDGETVARARRAGLDPVLALAATDATPLLVATGDLVVTGPTGTNVADLVVALSAPA